MEGQLASTNNHNIIMCHLLQGHHNTHSRLPPLQLFHNQVMPLLFNSHCLQQPCLQLAEIIDEISTEIIGQMATAFSSNFLFCFSEFETVIYPHKVM